MINGISMKSKQVYLYIVFLFLISTSSSISGQTFTASIDNTTLSGAIGSEIVFDFHVENVSNDTISLYFLRKTNTLPEGWTSSLCFERCLAPHIDSIVTNEQYGSSPIGIGESRSFSLHVFPQSTEGDANFEVKIANLNNPDDYLTFDLVATTTPTSVRGGKFLTSFKLYQNYPNPFNPSTKISFELSENGNAKITVYDLLGNEISIITDKYYSKGIYEIEFNPSAYGKNLSSGIYFYKLESNNFVQVKKMIIGK